MATKNHRPKPGDEHYFWEFDQGAGDRFVPYGEMPNLEQREEQIRMIQRRIRARAEALQDGKV